MATLISSMSLTSFLYVFLLLGPLCSLKKCYAVEGDESTKAHFHSLKVFSLLPSTAACNRSSKGSHPTVEHLYGPCRDNNYSNQKPTNAPSNLEILGRDKQRVDSIRSRLAGHGVFHDTKAALPVQSGLSMGSGDYVVKVGLGTPKKEFSLIFDTGSDITWTQCEPCVKTCYDQMETKLNPTKSTSYRNISCSSDLCNLVSTEGEQSCSSSTCQYQVQYGDQSYSVGFFATETLTISPSDVFKNFLFGCGQSNDGLFGGAAGLLGLGRTKLSLPSQTVKKYRKLFSYCLPASLSSTGYLKFGSRVSKAVKFTPLSKSFESTPFYGLDITGISVGKSKLSIDQSVFAEGGTIIDSGTVITRLPPTAYSELSSAFKKLMKGYYPLTSGYSIFDTCYDLSKYDNVLVPKISVFFKGGVEMDIDASGILYPVSGPKRVCLAFAGNDDDTDTSIFGNVQQKTYEVVYDGTKGRVGFAPASCS